MPQVTTNPEERYEVHRLIAYTSYQAHIAVVLQADEAQCIVCATEKD